MTNNRDLSPLLAGRVKSGGNNVPIVVAIVSVRRPGPIDYLEGTLRSLACAVNSSDIPMAQQLPVVVFNGEWPAKQHTAFHQLANAEVFPGLQSIKVAFVNHTSLHEELHAPAFVQRLAAWTTAVVRQAAWRHRSWSC